MKDCPCGHRNLIFALTALVQLTRTVKTVRAVTTSGTTIPLWPSKQKEMLYAGFLRGKSLLELYQAQLLLLHCNSTSPLTSGWLVIQLRSKSNNPLHKKRVPEIFPLPAAFLFHLTLQK
jgi:hypothetical protein